MTNLGKFFLITASGVALCACGGETAFSTPPKEQAVKTVTAEVSPSKVKNPQHCDVGRRQSHRRFNLVTFDLTSHEGILTRIGYSKMLAEMKKISKLENLSPETKAEAALPFEAKAQAMALLSIQGNADEVLSLYVRRCNFEIYEKTKCTGDSSRKIVNANIIGGILTYNSLIAKGQETKITIARTDNSDITIEARGGVSHWWRTSDGVENFTFTEPNKETKWTENPDCSGEISNRDRDKFTEASWTSPITEPAEIDYRYCSKGKCSSGKI